MANIGFEKNTENSYIVYFGPRQIGIVKKCHEIWLDKYWEAQTFDGSLVFKRTTKQAAAEALKNAAEVHHAANI